MAYGNVLLVKLLDVAMGEMSHHSPFSSHTKVQNIHAFIQCSSVNNYF